MPRRMSQAVAAKAVERIAEHAEKHRLDSVEIILHGGEPLLAGPDWLAELIHALRSRVPAQVNVAMQTNGTLLDRPMLETLKTLGVRIGVSLDGDAEATGLHRRYADGRNSFDAVADGLRLLQEPEFRECYSGILCTIDVRNDPVATYESLLKFSPPTLDLLLPHANWSSPPPGPSHAEWLISVFERWYCAPRQETQIRLFRELIQLVLGQPGAVEGLGLLPSTLVVVDTDGAIKQLDSLSSAYPGAADTGLHVLSSGFDDALEHPTTVARQIGAEALSPQCRACQVMEICGGGLYPHRYRPGEGFRNRSVYCADLLRLIGRISGTAKHRGGRHPAYHRCSFCLIRRRTVDRISTPAGRKFPEPTALRAITLCTEIEARSVVAWLRSRRRATRPLHRFNAEPFMVAQCTLIGIGTVAMVRKANSPGSLTSRLTGFAVFGGLGAPLGGVVGWYSGQHRTQR